MNLLKKCVEGNNRQVLKGCTNRKIVRVNRILVFVMESQIDIIDHVRSFLCKTLMHLRIKNTENQKRRKLRKELSNNDQEFILARCLELEQYIKFCMHKFTTYIIS